MRFFTSIETVVVHSSLIFIVVLLAIVTVVMGILRARCDDPGSELYLRVRSWAWILLLLSLLTVFGHVAWFGLLCVLIYLGGKEIYRAYHIRKSMKKLMILAVHLFVWLVLAMASLGILLSGFPEDTGIAFVLYFIFAVQSNDVSQYIFGKTLGQRPLIPSISPNKTIEGAVGGVLFSSIFATFVALYLTDLPMFQAWWISLSLGILGTIGDMMVSHFKRHVGIKDMGSLLPGHGGLLDRIDSLLLSAPGFFVLLCLTGTFRFSDAY